MTDLVSQLVAELQDMRGKVIELCQTYGNPLPDASIERIDAALTAAKAGGWQDISTAPKNTMVLAAVEFDHPGDWRIKTGYLDSEVGAWRVFGASWTPTKWQPLPAPPAQRGEG